jgi:CRISPR-associated exonuclease Cas4
MIPINLIRQYHFCPRIVYFQELTNIKPYYPRHVSLGEDYHKIQEKLSKNRKFKKLNITFEEVIIDKYIENVNLNICGKVDLALVCKDEIIPIEFKDIDTKKPSYSHILQLCGYGILLEKYYKKEFRKAYISYSNNMKLFPINITPKIKNDFFDTLEKIKQILQNDILPNSSANENKCSQCEYLNFCDDRI